MTDDMRLLAAPKDPDASHRIHRLQELGLSQQPDLDLDKFAQQVASDAETPCAMVSLFAEADQYYFAGLAMASSQAGLVRTGPANANRTMPRDHGFCPFVVERRRPLPLSDVCASPRFASNPVVWDQYLSVRTYLGAPLIDRTGTVLGTVCAVGPHPREWGQEGLQLIKAKAQEAVTLIESRAASH